MILNKTSWSQMYWSQMSSIRTIHMFGGFQYSSFMNVQCHPLGSWSISRPTWPWVRTGKMGLVVIISRPFLPFCSSLFVCLFVSLCVFMWLIFCFVFLILCLIFFFCFSVCLSDCLLSPFYRHLVLVLCIFYLKVS